MNRKHMIRVAGAIAMAVLLFWTLVPAADATAASPRPFKGKASGTFVIAQDGIGGTGTVVATHVGRSNVDFSGIGLAEAPAPDTCVASTGGEQEITAANGDTLQMVYASGQICFDAVGSPVAGQFTLSVTGGTGRFLGATGTIYINATGDFPNFTSVLTGSISY